MGVIAFLAILSVALAEGIDSPELRQYIKTLKFNWKKVSRTDDYTVSGTTYYSHSLAAYRFDAEDNYLFVFIDQHRGQAEVYYYFPQFINNYHSHGCYKMNGLTHGQRFSFPIPKIDQSYQMNGEGSIDGTLVYRYSKTSRRFDNNQTEESDLYFTDPKAKGFPVRLEYKTWYTDQFDEQYRLDRHEVTDYYDIQVAGNVFNPPIMQCDGVPPNDNRGEAITAYGITVNVPQELKCILNRRYCSGVLTTYRTGFKANADNPQFQNKNADYGDLPDSWDWRDRGAVTPVKNQRDCGACWAFGAVAALESAYSLKHNQSVVLSEQYLIDCDWSGDNQGCTQGSARSAYDWIYHRQRGIPRSSDYPYKNMNGYCQYDDSLQLLAPINNYTYIAHNEKDLKSAVYNEGPVVVFIDSTPMLSYTNGIITDCTPNNQINKNHFVLVVGFGVTEDNQRYWIIKNSWGSGWGMDGYGLISADGNDGNCLGILDVPLFPNIM